MKTGSRKVKDKQDEELNEELATQKREREREKERLDSIKRRTKENANDYEYGKVRVRH
jgi:hypothetical protein